MGATLHPVPVASWVEAAPQAGENAIALVSAHMAGLPLNHQITSLGGRFLEATATSPDYRLFVHSNQLGANTCGPMSAKGPLPRSGQEPSLIRMVAGPRSAALNVCLVPPDGLEPPTL